MDTELVTIGIIMGSASDYETMKHAEDIFIEFHIPYEIAVMSAHRTPELMFDYARSAPARGLKLIIAGAGGAAHLPGMVSALTTVPVLAVPVQSKALSGLDSLLSIVQMPSEPQERRMPLFLPCRYWPSPTRALKSI